MGGHVSCRVKNLFHLLAGATKHGKGGALFPSVLKLLTTVPNILHILNPKRLARCSS